MRAMLGQTRGRAMRTAGRKTKSSCASILAGAGALFFLSSEAFSQRAYAPLARGQELLKQHCASCHQIGWGASPNKEAPPFRDLMKRYGASALEEALAEGLLNGHAPGTEFEFEATEVDAIIRYLSTLGGKR